MSGLKWEIKAKKDKTLKNNADRLYFEESCQYIYLTTVHFVHITVMKIYNVKINDRKKIKNKN